jgi:type I restriction enzyme, S subunit
VTIEDCGLLPPSWAWASIGDVTELKVAQGGPSAGSVFRYVDISSVDNKAKRISEPKMVHADVAPTRARQKLKAGDVLVSMTRPNLNAVALVPESLDGSIGSTGFDVLRPVGIDPRWIYFFVQTRRFIYSMSARVQGALYPAVRPKDIRTFSLPVAPLAEQHRIVEAIEAGFTRLDVASARFARVLTSLSRFRASLLSTAFMGRLVPTEDELAKGVGSGYESGQELIARIVRERRSRPEHQVREKAMRELLSPDPGGNSPHLPEGWAWSTFGSIATIESDSVDPQRFADSPHLAPDNIEGWTGRLLPCRTIKEDGITSPNHRFRRGMIIYSKIRPYLAKAAIAPFDGLCSADMYPISTSIDTRFLLHWMLSTQFVSQAIAHQGRSLLPKINQAALVSLLVPVPPLAEQRRIGEKLEHDLSVVGSVAGDVQRGLNRCTRLRQAILKAAFEGRLVHQDPNEESANALLTRVGSKQRQSPHPSAQLARRRTAMEG